MTLDLRLAAPAVVAWIAVGVLIGHPELLIVSAVGLWLVAAVGVTMAVALGGARSRSIAVGIALACAAAALLVSVAAVRQPQRQPEFLADAAQSGRFVTATVETSQAAGSPGEPFTATLGSLNVGGGRFSANVPVLVFVDDPLGSVGIGSTLNLRGTVSMTDPADSAALLFFTDRRPTVVEEPPWFLDWANELRATFRGSAAALPGSGGDLLPGLAIGDTSAVSARLDAAMKATSLSHLTAVSGDTRSNRGESSTCEQMRASLWIPAHLDSSTESMTIQALLDVTAFARSSARPRGAVNWFRFLWA
jgi:competence protein ComEC